MAYIILKKNKEQRVLTGHPWVYQGEVNKIKGAFTDGDIAGVKDYKERFLGQGFINRNSQILVRLITDRKETVDKYRPSNIAIRTRDRVSEMLHPAGFVGELVLLRRATFVHGFEELVSTKPNT